MEEMITAYEDAIIKALIGQSKNEHGYTSAKEALDAYIDEFDLKNHPIDLLKNFIGLCCPTEFAELKDMDFEIFDKMIENA